MKDAAVLKRCGGARGTSFLFTPMRGRYFIFGEVGTTSKELSLSYFLFVAAGVIDAASPIQGVKARASDVLCSAISMVSG